MKYLIVATLGVFCASGTFAKDSSEALSALSRLEKESLYEMALVRGRSPVTGATYGYPEGNILKVQQVIGDGKVLVVMDAPVNATRAIVVKTWRSYVDEDRLAKGFYREAGKFSYENVLGASKTVYLFEEFSESVERKMFLLKQDSDAIQEARQREQAETQRGERIDEELQKSKARIAAEEAAVKAKLEADAKAQENALELARLEREKQERINELEAKHAQEQGKLKPKIQLEREEYAKTMLSTFDFNIKHRYFVQRSIRKVVKSIQVTDPLWLKLVELQTAQDWLGMLSAVEGDELDEYPKAKVIDAILKDLKNQEFEIFVEAEGETYVYFCFPDRAFDSGQYARGITGKKTLKWEVFSKKCYLLGWNGMMWVQDKQKELLHKQITDNSVVGLEEWLRVN